MEDSDEKQTNKNAFKLLEGEFLVQCPYNLSHQVINLRMDLHLPKCRRNYSRQLAKKGEDVLMMTCKYNWTHIVPAPEILYHETHCSDRLEVTPYLVKYLEDDKTNPGEIITKYVLYLTKGVKPNAEEFLTADGMVNDGAVAGPSSASVPISETNRACGGPNGALAREEGGEEDWLRESKRKKGRMINPRVNSINKLSLKYPKNLSPSERKDFRKYNVEKAKRLAGTPGSQTFRPRLVTTPSDEEAERETGETEAFPSGYTRPLDKYEQYLDKALMGGLEGLRIQQEEHLSRMAKAERKKLDKPPLQKKDTHPSDDEDDWNT